MFRLWQCGYFSLNEQNEQLKQQLKNEKQLNAEIKKRLVEVEYDLSKEKSKVEQIEQLEKRVSYLEDNLCNWRMK